jgi:hypothetical protein
MCGIWRIVAVSVFKTEFHFYRYRLISTLIEHR